MSRRLAVFCWAIAVLLFFVTIALGVYGYYISWQYEKDIGGYVSNAIDMVSPEGMLEQIQLARQGMVNAGLNENDYGAWIFKKPSNSMKFQYQHIDSIIERINSVIDWKKKVYSNQSQSAETLGDVYEQKMTNLREYINGETSESISGSRSDWVAEDAWWVKYHFFMSYFGIWLGLFLVLASASFVILGVISWRR